MNLDELTIGEAKKLAALLGGFGSDQPKSSAIGKYVVVRTFGAGVHVGKLAWRRGEECELTEARRIWSWNGAKTLHEISLRGVDASKSKLSDQVASIELIGVMEVLPTTTESETNLRGVKWQG